MLISGGHRCKQKYFKEYQDSLGECLEHLPDMTLEMRLQCRSKMLPFVKKFAPSDTYKVGLFLIFNRFIKEEGY